MIMSQLTLKINNNKKISNLATNHNNLTKIINNYPSILKNIIMKTSNKLNMNKYKNNNNIPLICINNINIKNNNKINMNNSNISIMKKKMKINKNYLILYLDTIKNNQIHNNMNNNSNTNKNTNNNNINNNNMIVNNKKTGNPIFKMLFHSPSN